MKSTGTSYNWARSLERLDEILDSSDASYRERDDLPGRDSLTFKNGFYIRTAALFVDMRDSTGLPSSYTLPALAKLYRAFLSEVVAVLDGCSVCEEVSISGDGAWGVFDARKKGQLDEVVDAAATLSSLINLFNEKLVARGYHHLYVGIGLEWGRALMIKTGYSSSGINDVVYVGNVVNQAAKLCSRGEAARGFGRNPRVIAGSEFVSNIGSTVYKSFFHYDSVLQCYTADIFDKAMEPNR